MNNQIKISKFDAMNKQDLENTSGGVFFAPVLIGTAVALYAMALYGAFMDGYNSGKAAAGR